jgi:hypothetical protein
MNVGFTGAHVGDVLLGVGGQTYQAKMVVTSSSKPGSQVGVRPSMPYVVDSGRMASVTNFLRDHALIQEMFASRPDPSKSYYDFVVDYLKSIAVATEELFYHDRPFVRFMSLGNSSNDFFKKLSEEQRDAIMNGDYESIDPDAPVDDEGGVDLAWINSLFTDTGKATSAKEKCLIFRYSNWNLDIQPAYEGSAHDLNAGYKLRAIDQTTPSLHTSLGFGDIHIFRAIRPGSRFSAAEAKDLCVGKYQVEPRMELACLTPGVLKSLLQKIIRSRALSFSGIPAKDLIVTVIYLFCFKVGKFFLPNLTRYSTGIEAVTKRLAVIVIEDSFTTKFDLIARMLGVAMLESVKQYGPIDRDLFVEMIDLALEAHAEPRKFKYNHREPGDLPAFVPGKSLDCAAVLVHCVGGFESDINMFISVANNKGVPDTKTVERQKLLDEIPIWHCMDQHCIANIGHFCFTAPAVITKETGRPAITFQSYTELFGKIWDISSSYNPRLGSKLKTDDMQFQTIRRAQQLLWEGFFPPTPSDDLKTKVKEAQKVNLELSNSLGDIVSMFIDKVKVDGKDYIVALRLLSSTAVARMNEAGETPPDVFDFVIFPKPSRTTKAEPIKDEKLDQIKDIVIRKLFTTGIALTPTKMLEGEFKSARLYFRDGVWSISDGPRGDLIPIGDRLRYAATVRHFPTAESWMLNPWNAPMAATFSRHWLVEDFVEQIINTVSGGLHVQDMVHLKSYIPGGTNVPSVIKLNPLSMSGKGIYLQSNVLDTKVSEILCLICNLAPCAVCLGQHGFQVRDKNILSYMVTQLDRYVNSMIVANPGTSKGVPRGYEISDDGRKLTNAQVDILTDLAKHELEQGQLKHAIWAEAGMGKTKTAIHWIADVLSRSLHQLPRFVIMSGPSSCLVALATEFGRFGVEINQFSLDNRTILPYRINLISHDHIRKLSECPANDDPCYAQWHRSSQPKRKALGFTTSLHEEIMASDFVFVLDEFHECLNSTIRTSLAYQLASASSRAVFMTGTMVKDLEINHLVKWLNLASSFEINSVNYLAGFAGVVTALSISNIQVNRETFSVDLEDDEQAEYDEVTPSSLGGSSPRLYLNKALEICYRATDRKIAELVSKQIDLSPTDPNKSQGAFVVAENAKHCDRLAAAISAANRKANILILQGDQFPCLEPGTATPYNVVIAPMNRALGYTMTKFNVMITSIYRSNGATRTQIEHRINRVSQNRPAIYIQTVVAGILHNIQENYNSVREFTDSIISALGSNEECEI